MKGPQRGEDQSPHEVQYAHSHHKQRTKWAQKTLGSFFLFVRFLRTKYQKYNNSTIARSRIQMTYRRICWYALDLRNSNIT